MTLFCKEIYKFLGSSNLLAWKRRIHIVLEENEVIDHINGKDSKPSEGQALYEYMERDQRAQGILMKSIKGPLIPYIVGLETSKEKYDKLVKLFFEDTIKKVISLGSNLHKLKVTNAYDDKKAIPFNNLHDRRRQVVGKRCSNISWKEGEVWKIWSSKRKNIAKIQCYKHYRKDCPKLKEGNNKEDREEVHFTKVVEEAERRKSKEEEKH